MAHSLDIKPFNFQLGGDSDRYLVAPRTFSVGINIVRDFLPWQWPTQKRGRYALGMYIWRALVGSYLFIRMFAKSTGPGIRDHLFLHA